MRPCFPKTRRLRGTGVRVAVAAAALGGLLTCGCPFRPATPPPPQAPAASRPLAVVGDVRIEEADVAAEVRRRQAAGEPAADGREVLQKLIERQAMLQAAARSPWVKTPDARRERENQLLVQWLDRALEEEKDRAVVTDAELRSHYEAHLQEHGRPGQVRLAILHRRPSSSVDGESPAALTNELRRHRQAFLDNRDGATRCGRIPGFGSVAVDASEDTATRHRGGDLGWLEAGRTDYRWPAEVLRAGAALPTGGVSDVIGTDQGLFVVMKCDERAPRTAPFDEVAPALRRRLVREKREAVQKAFMRDLLARTSVVVDEERADRLTVATAAQPVTAAMLPVPPLPDGPGDR